uniref:Condensin II complex subunit H2 N-terminal domain-containing protein n=1 Tax=Sexangularia sp. CB-2014 TaxID=1486929 RepID=A0A7S1Y9N5_9EUKA
MAESREKRFASLLQPMKDLSENWSIDIAAELAKYSEELHNVRVDVGGADLGLKEPTSLSFLDAAMLIQRSTLVYSRKVEYLHALCDSTLELVGKREHRRRARVAAHAREANPAAAFEDEAEFGCVLEEAMAGESFLPLDDVDMAPPSSTQLTAGARAAASAKLAVLQGVGTTPARSSRTSTSSSVASSVVGTPTNSAAAAAAAATLDAASSARRANAVMASQRVAERNRRRAAAARGARATRGGAAAADGDRDGDGDVPAEGVEVGSDVGSSAAGIAAERSVHRSGALLLDPTDIRVSLAVLAGADSDSDEADEADRDESSAGPGFLPASPAVSDAGTLLTMGDADDDENWDIDFDEADADHELGGGGLDEGDAHGGGEDDEDDEHAEAGRGSGVWRRLRAHQPGPPSTRRPVRVQRRRLALPGAGEGDDAAVDAGALSLSSTSASFVPPARVDLDPHGVDVSLRSTESSEFSYLFDEQRRLLRRQAAARRVARRERARERAEQEAEAVAATVEGGRRYATRTRRLARADDADEQAEAEGEADVEFGGGFEVDESRSSAATAGQPAAAAIVGIADLVDLDEHGNVPAPVAATPGLLSSSSSSSAHTTTYEEAVTATMRAHATATDAAAAFGATRDATDAFALAIAPKLAHAAEQPEFDMQAWAATVWQRVAERQQDGESIALAATEAGADASGDWRLVPFGWLTTERGTARWEVARTFVATLQLANEGKLTIVANEAGELQGVATRVGDSVVGTAGAKRAASELVGGGAASPAKRGRTVGASMQARLAATADASVKEVASLSASQSFVPLDKENAERPSTPTRRPITPPRRRTPTRQAAKTPLRMIR